MSLSKTHFLFSIVATFDLLCFYDQVGISASEVAFSVSFKRLQISYWQFLIQTDFIIYVTYSMPHIESNQDKTVEPNEVYERSYLAQLGGRF